MYHPVLLQTEVLRQLPALLDDLRPAVDEIGHLSYRSEAFAEDLPDHVAAAPAPAAPARRRPLAGVLFAAPLGLSLVGAMAAALFGIGN